MAENNNIVIRELNPTKKEEGDIFFHNEYNSIVDVVKNHKDILRRVFDKNFPFDLTIGVNKEYLEPNEKVNLKFDWEYDRDLTDQYAGSNSTTDQIPVTVRTKTFNNIVGKNDNETSFVFKLKAESNDLKLFVNYYIETISPLYLSANEKDKLLQTDIDGLSFFNSENKDKYIRKYKNPIVFSNEKNFILDPKGDNINQEFEYYVNCNGGKYIYILSPHYISTEIFVGGLKNTAWEITTMNVKNQFNGITSYNIYRSTYKFNSRVPIKLIVTNNE